MNFDFDLKKCPAKPRLNPVLQILIHGINEVIFCDHVYVGEYVLCPFSKLKKNSPEVF